METECRLELDPLLYLRPPVLDTAGAISLASALISALPSGAGPATRAAAKQLRLAAVELQAAWIDRNTKKEDPRPFDNRLDRAWSALRSRLAAYAELPAEGDPGAPPEPGPARSARELTLPPRPADPPAEGFTPPASPRRLERRRVRP